MRIVLLILFFCISASSFSQSEILALNYFNNGAFEKALISYEKLYAANKGNSNFLFKIIEIHQQLEHLDISENLLFQELKKSKNPLYLVELGYNYQLKNELEKAADYYNQAVAIIDDTPMYAGTIARRFETHALIDYAAIVYEKAMILRPEFNYNIPLARIYGEQGKIE